MTGKILVLIIRDINECSLDSLRKNIGLVTQETILFNDTIEANIRYGNLNASSKEIEDVASQAGVSEFADSLPNKLQNCCRRKWHKIIWRTTSTHCYCKGVY